MSQSFIEMHQENLDRLASKDPEPLPTDEDLYCAYIGKNAKVMAPRAHSHRPINVFAFIFGPFYYAYRKMYAVAGLYLALNGVLALTGLYPNPMLDIVSGVANFILSVVFAVLFYTLYDAHVQKVVQKTKESVAPEDQRKKITDMGDTAALAVVIALVIAFALGWGIHCAQEYVFTGSKAIVNEAIEQSLIPYEDSLAEELQYAEDRHYTTDISKYDRSIIDKYEAEAEAEDEDEDIYAFPAEYFEQCNLECLINDKKMVEDLTALQDRLSKLDPDDADGIRGIYAELKGVDDWVATRAVTDYLNEETQLPLPWEATK